MPAPRRPVVLDPGLDARLVGRCLSGDARAWEALVRRHERLVYAVARSYRLDEDDLADVFQEVFAALVRGLPRLRDPRTLVRWLSSTTDRIALATALRRRREQALTGGEPEAAERLPDPGPAAGEDLETLEEQALVRLALGDLAGRCRDLLGALYYEDPAPSYGEISRRLRLPVGSIGPTRARCLEKLRDRLAALGGEGAGITGAASPTSSRERGRGPGPTGRPARPAAD